MSEPRGAGALLGWAWRLYLANWRPALAIAATASVVEWLLTVATAHPGPGPFATVAVPSPLGAIVSAIFAIWSSATLLNFFGGPADGPRTDGGAVMACARLGLLRLWPFFVTSVVVGLVGGVGFLLLIIPGVWLITRWGVAIVVAATGRGPAVAALSRSFALTAGHFWHALGTLLLGTLLPSLLAAAATAAGTAILTVIGLRGSAGIGLWGALMAAAASPWSMATLVALYDDLVLRSGAAD